MKLWHNGLQEWFDDDRLYLMIWDTMEKLDVSCEDSFILSLSEEFTDIAESVLLDYLEEHDGT